jgi:hypothetical protein
MRVPARTDSRGAGSGDGVWDAPIGHGRSAHMTFECDGQRYDSAELIEYRTGDGHTPLIYTTPDHGRVFVAVVDRWNGVDVRPVEAAEIETLATRFDLPELRRAIH